MNTNRHSFSLRAGVALALGLAIAGAGLFSARQALGFRGVKIRKGKVRPRRMPAAGGTVNLTLNIRVKGVTITSVKAAARRSDGTRGSVASLSKTSGKSAGNQTWEGSISVPANTKAAVIKDRIQVTVTHSGGTTSKTVAKVRIAAGDGDGGGDDGGGPPPPPPI